MTTKDYDEFEQWRNSDSTYNNMTKDEIDQYIQSDNQAIRNTIKQYYRRKGKINDSTWDDDTKNISYDINDAITKIAILSMLSNYKSVKDKKLVEQHIVDYLTDNGLDIYYPPGHTAPYDFLLKINKEIYPFNVKYEADLNKGENLSTNQYQMWLSLYPKSNIETGLIKTNKDGKKDIIKKEDQHYFDQARDELTKITKKYFSRDPNSDYYYLALEQNNDLAVVLPLREILANGKAMWNKANIKFTIDKYLPSPKKYNYYIYYPKPDQVIQGYIDSINKGNMNYYTRDKLASKQQVTQQQENLYATPKIKQLQHQYLMNTIDGQIDTKDLLEIMKSLQKQDNVSDYDKKRIENAMKALQESSE